MEQLRLWLGQLQKILQPLFFFSRIMSYKEKKVQNWGGGGGREESPNPNSKSM